MAKINRVIDNAFISSPHDVQSTEYNPASGGQKSLIVGPRYLPIPIVTAGSATWKTNVTSATALPSLGMILAIYNNAGTAASITVGQDATVTSQAIGAVDANGNVGVALPPNAWTYLSMGANQWIIASAATVIVYIIEDPTKIIRESGAYIQQNVPSTALPVNS